MNSNLFRVDVKDFAKGAVVSVLASVFTLLGTALSDPSFDFASFDWAGLGKLAFATLMGYVGKNFFSDQNGKLGGVL
jgi:hypothetical protein